MIDIGRLGPDRLKIFVRNPEILFSDIAFDDDKVLKRRLRGGGDVLDVVHRLFDILRLNQ